MHAGIQCEELPPLGNGSILYHIGTSFPGTIAMYMCEDGFFLDGDDETNCITEEAGSGTVWVWSGQEPRCARKLRKNVLITLASNNFITAVCTDLPRLANGMIIYNRTVARYTCDEGFQLLGDEIRTCEDGVWAEASPVQCTQGVLQYVTIIAPCNNSTTVCSD